MEGIVPFEISKKLQEKGFKEKCFAYYTKDSNFYYNTSYGQDVENVYKSFNSHPNYICGKRIDAPTISQVLKWLRNEKNIHIIIDFFTYIDTNETHWYYSVKDIKDGTSYTNYMYEGRESYENSALAGIEYVLDLI